MTAEYRELRRLATAAVTSFDVWNGDPDDGERFIRFMDAMVQLGLSLGIDLVEDGLHNKRRTNEPKTG